MSNQAQLKGAARDLYLELVRQCPLVSIRSSRELRAAHKMIDALMANRPLDEGEEVYLDALSDLVIVYEDENVDIDPASDSELLTHLIQAKGVSQAEASVKLGISKSTISEVLSGKRKLTRSQIHRCADYFQVEPGAFMRTKRS